MSQQFVSSRLTGRRPFDLEELQDICEWLGIDAIEILSRAQSAVA